MTELSTFVSEDATLARLFVDFPITISPETGAPVFPTPLTDFSPRPLYYRDVHHIAKLMVEAVPPAVWSRTPLIVGNADRASGAIIHVMASIVAASYTLMNFYPKGPRPAGSIYVCDVSIHGRPGEFLINGLTPGDCVVFADVIIRRGTLANKVVEALQKNGIQVQAAVFGADFSDRDGLKSLKRLLPSTHSVGTIMVSEHGEPLQRTAFKRNLLAGRLEAPPREVADFIRTHEVPSTRPLHTLPLPVQQSVFKRCLDSWVGMPIYKANEGSGAESYPYSCFQLTDCVPVMTVQIIEDTADCLLMLSPLLRKILENGGATAEQQNEYIFVSESDRGGGPLVAAIARRTGLAFTMANWSSEVEQLSSNAVTGHVGYSGSVTLFLNGIRRGQKCIIVDDMLSSGGTCEQLIKCVEQAGGVVVECLFASEKTTSKGRERLHMQWPKVPLFSVCFFQSVKECTEVSHPDPLLGHETPIQTFSSRKRIKEIVDE